MYVQVQYICTIHTYIHVQVLRTSTLSFGSIYLLTYWYISTCPDWPLMVTNYYYYDYYYCHNSCIWGGGGDYGRGGKGKDRQPVPRAKLFCLRFCGRIGFVARFTLTLDKHLFSVFGLEDDGGESAPEGRSYPIGWKTKRRAIISGITPKAAAAGAQDGWWWVGRKFFYFGWVRPGEAKWLLLYIVHCTRTVIKIREQLIT